MTTDLLNLPSGSTSDVVSSILDEIIESVDALSLQRRIGYCFDSIQATYNIGYETIVQTTQGGEIRKKRGDLCENMIDIICSELTRLDLVELDCRIGSKDKQCITINGSDRNVSIEHQVERHIYHLGKLVAVVECKSYLDSCYYTRACSDLRRMSLLHPTVKRYVFALENSICDSTKEFVDAEYDHICHRVFYMLDGKRNSHRPICN